LLKTAETGQLLVATLPKLWEKTELLACPYSTASIRYVHASINSNDARLASLHIHQTQVFSAKPKMQADLHIDCYGLQVNELTGTGF
jgi:hypothetical protein